MLEEKKRWIKPQLTILGRLKTEEDVLGSCKWQTGTSGGPGSVYNCMNPATGAACRGHSKT